MTQIAPAEYRSDLAIAPGATLRELLKAMNMTQAELAKRIDRPASKLNQIIQGKRSITVDTALSLERVLPYPASFWMNLERNYRLALARLKQAKELERDVKWMRETIPVQELIKRGLVADVKTPRERLETVLSFFGVGSVKVWQKCWQFVIDSDVEFRRSRQQAKHAGRAAAWLRIGEIDAQSKTSRPFNKRKFQAALKDIRAATGTQPRKFEPLLRGLTDCGVIVSLVKEIPGAEISGATRWLARDKAHIQLSLRYKTDDQFWFTFFHEAAHVLLHDKEDVFLEPAGRAVISSKEDEANRYAANFLIPPGRATELPTLKTRQQIIDFAFHLGIAPGIVVGRLQHDGHISPARANSLKLKRKFEWIAK